MKVQVEMIRDGSVRTMPSVVAKALEKKGAVRVLSESAAPAPTYQTRMMTAAQAPQAAPYGFKADGTPRKRPAPPPRAKAQD